MDVDARGVSALGVSAAPTFTERMTFERRSRILFVHDPEPGQRERAGADGVYELVEVDTSATRLSIENRVGGAAASVVCARSSRAHDGDDHATNW